MQCSTCGFSLPEGAAFCTNCGSKMYSQGNAGNQPAGTPQVEPTIAASSSYQTPQANPFQNQQVVPPTVYGAPYSTPQQYSNEAPPPPPPVNVYGTPPPPNSYGTPYAQTPGYGQAPGSLVPPGQPPTPPTRRKGPGVGLIIGIIVLVLFIIGGGLLAIRAASGNSNNNTTNTVTPTATTAQATATTPAATPTSGTTTPSGAQIDPAAAAIITKAQTSSAIDSNDFPTHVTSNFAAGQNVYVTFNLTTNGQSGYAEAKLYSDTTSLGSKILTIQSNFDHGYFTATLNQAATGTVELYWCTQSDCSDAKLATFVMFTVS
ncbi:MAG TPA: zinc ribbon domain-containing protein [Ktedonobacteraceae bacterium]|nr:zinc ribbon domain-containing protein [Ktedonobacteraceae bacterium]